LKQPKARKSTNTLPPEEDPVKLKKRIASLEKDLGMMKELVGLLREFPAHRETKTTTDTETKSGKKKKPEISKGTDEKNGSVAQGDGPQLPPSVSGPTTGSK
jgi:hypothetical protein